MQEKTYQYALTQTPPNSMAAGITTQSIEVDLALARKQHQVYISMLEKLGLFVTTLPQQESFPDSHFIEDAAIIHNKVAILTRPGAKERRGEVDAISSTLKNIFPTTYELGGDENATLDGGDVLFIGNTVLIGISHRTTETGAQELKHLLQKINPNLSIHLVPFEGVLHLKSGLTALNPNTILINQDIKLHTNLPIKKSILLPKEESHAANTFIANHHAFIPPNCPQAKEAMLAANLTPIEIDMSEFRKMDGSFTCLSLIW